MVGRVPVHNLPKRRNGHVILKAWVAGIGAVPRYARVAAKVSVGMGVELRREPRNRYDSNAVMVLRKGRQLGYLRRAQAAQVAPHMDAGRRIMALVIAHGVREMTIDDDDDDDFADTEEVPELQLLVWDFEEYREISDKLLPPPTTATKPQTPAKPRRPRPYRRRRRLLAIAIARHGKPAAMGAARWARLRLLKLRRWLFPRVTWDD